MINSIKLRNYRNLDISVADIDLRNLIIAKNGSGKTNFLEAIFFAITGNTFRSISSKSEVIRLGAEFAKIEVSFVADKLEVIITKAPDRITVRKLLNQKPTLRRKINAKYKVILFAPHSVDLVNGSPSTRREDLNNFLVQIDFRYASLILKYEKILRNRNALIKNIREGKSSPAELDFWTKELALLGSEIYLKRNQFFDQIYRYTQAVAADIYHDFLNFETKYLPNFKAENDYFELLLEKYKANESKELAVGKTLYGIHKDDYEFILNDTNLKFFGSRGQQRIGSFIFKLAQSQYLKSQGQFHDCIFLIDDLMSELDDNHRKNISAYIISQGFQYIITGADIKEIPENMKEASRFIEL